MAPPVFQIRNRNGELVDVQSMPAVGQKNGDNSLPVIHASGVLVVQSFVPVPAFDGSTPDKLAASIVLVVPRNARRRYLKIINNGSSDVELWTGSKPTADRVNQAIRQGEILFKGGGGLAESGERISEIYATAATASGLLVLEG